MNRWAENCRLRWSVAKVPLVCPGCAVDAHGLSPTTLLLHADTPCVYSFEPRLLTPQDFWTVTLLPDGQVSFQPLPLPGIEPSQALRFAGFDERSRTLSVLLDDPDGSAAPESLREKRAATTRSDSWANSGVSCQEGAVSVRRFQFVEQPGAAPDNLVLQPLAQPQPPAAGAIPSRLHFDPSQDDRWHEVFTLLSPAIEHVDAGLQVKFSYEFIEPNDDYENTYVVSDVASGAEVGRLQTRHHPNSSVQAFAGDLLLLPDENPTGEDAFYNEMRLFNWRTGELVRRLPLADPRYIEVEWPRGLLPGGSQTFFTVGRTYGAQLPDDDDLPEKCCSVFFLSPQPAEEGEAAVDDGQVAGGCSRMPAEMQAYVTAEPGEGHTGT